ncbi:hypothetical protein JOM56_008600 [Amanita muscaria]
MIHRLIFLSLLIVSVIASRLPPLTVQDGAQHTDHADVKVPVELGVMSRCPDAIFCETIFDRVLQQVKDKVTLSMRYIAKLDPSEPTFGVECMHGPEECAGNVQQLCVAKHASQSHWWEFVQCQNFGGREHVGQPSLALKCARAVGIDWESSGVGQCAGLDGSGTGAEGVKLLQDSVALTSKLGIKKSCTIIIDGKKVCIHDGKWKRCYNGHSVKDFVRQINEAYDRLNYGQV